jgi:hypothetical protein
MSKLKDTEYTQGNWNRREVWHQWHKKFKIIEASLKTNVKVIIQENYWQLIKALLRMYVWKEQNNGDTVLKNQSGQPALAGTTTAFAFFARRAWFLRFVKQLFTRFCRWQQVTFHFAFFHAACARSQTGLPTSVVSRWNQRFLPASWG